MSSESEFSEHSRGWAGLFCLTSWPMIILASIFLLCRYTSVRKTLGFKFMHLIFSKFLPDHPKMFNAAFGKQKEDLFGGLANDFGSSGKLHVVEIGAGSGANFKFFPRGTVVTCLEPNAHCGEALRKSVESTNGDVILDEVIVGKAEDMRTIKDNSVDAVVSSLVMCCVDSVDDTLREVKRILKPGGKLYCIENATPASFSAIFMWYLLRYAFEKNVKWETYMSIYRAGFSDVSLKFYEAMSFRAKVPFFVKPFVGTRIYCGTATK